MRFKGLIASLAILMLFVGCPEMLKTTAVAGGRIECINTQTSDAILASASDTSDAIELWRYRPDGYFSLQWTITGTGTAKIEYNVSHDGTNYQEPVGATDIATGQTAGTNSASFTPIIAPYIKIKVTETGGANAVTVTCILCLQ